MGSLTSLNKRARGSLTSLNRMGGSLMSIGGKERRSITAMARNVGQKVERAGEKAREKVKVARGRRAEERLGRLEEGWGSNRDPGVNSDEEEEEGREDMFQFDRLSHRSSIRSELSLGKLGTVSPAVSTPDLEAMRRPAVVGRRWGEVQEEEEQEEEEKWREPEEEEEVIEERKVEEESTEDEGMSITSYSSAATMAEDYSLPSYQQAVSNNNNSYQVYQVLLGLSVSIFIFKS